MQFNNFTITCTLLKYTTTRKDKHHSLYMYKCYIEIVSKNEIKRNTVFDEKYGDKIIITVPREKNENKIQSKSTMLKNMSKKVF